MTGKVGPFTIPPSVDLLGKPAETGAHLRYARENIERSIMLLDRGDVRYAVFSANEGLELCVKAYLMHYRLVDEPIESGHFPYAVLIDKLEGMATSFEEYNPGNDDAMRQPEYFKALRKYFRKTEKQNVKTALWKRSLGIDLGRAEQERLDKLEQDILAFGGAAPGAERGIPPAAPDRSEEAAAKALKDRIVAWPLALFHRDTGRGNRRLHDDVLGRTCLPVENLLYIGQVEALAELFLYSSDIVSGYVHQQTSRYPTVIDGVDSRCHYLRHRGGVGRLLARLYRASGELMLHSDALSTPVLRSSSAFFPGGRFA